MADVISEITSFLFIAAMCFGFYKFAQHVTRTEREEKKRMESDPLLRIENSRMQPVASTLAIIAVVSIIVGGISYYTMDPWVVAATSIPLCSLSALGLFLIFRSSKKHNDDIERIIASYQNKNEKV